MSAEKLGGLVNLKKKRSLDLQTLYQTEAGNRGRSDSKGKHKEEEERNGVRRKRKQKGTKDVCSARLDRVDKSSSRVDVEEASGVEAQQSNAGSGDRWNGLPYCLLSENGDPVRVPKRPRNVFFHKNSKNQTASLSLRLQGSADCIRNLHDEADTSEDAHLEKKGSRSEASGVDRLSKSGKASLGVGNVVCNKPKQKVGVNESRGSKNARLPKKPGLPVNESIADDDMDKFCKHFAGNAASEKFKPKVGVNKPKRHKNAHMPKKSSLSVNEPSADEAMAKLGKHFVGIAVGEKLKPKVGADESKKRKNARLQKTPSLSGNETSAADQIINIGKVSAGGAVNGKYKRTVAVNVFKGNKNIKVTSAQHTMTEDEHCIIKNADASSKKRRRVHRKEKNLQSRALDSVKDVESPVANKTHCCDDFQDDDDEENLEQNAARMLSSRFDPRCTGFSSRRKSSALSFANQVSSLISSNDLTSQNANSLARSEAAAGVPPMEKDHKEKSVPRKRRHFYEVHLKDLDAYEVLNKRIQVFFPLDETWCCGLLKDYDPEKRLHQVKYDGRDEVWINLEGERFKLLLFPSEVPGKDKSRRSAKGSRTVCEDKTDLDVDGDSHSGSYLESEPIISWLSHRFKSSSRPLKKQKISEQSSSILSLPSHDQHDDTKDILGSLDIETDAGTAGKSSSGSGSVSENKITIVYMRRRFRKKVEGQSYTEDGTTCEKMALAASSVNKLTLKSEVNTFPGSQNDAMLWSIDDEGLLSLCLPFIESRHFTYDIHLPALSCIQHDAEYIWLSRIVLLLQHGAIVTKWPEVILEILFVDNTVGLRFLLFECCLKDAMVLAFIVMSLFSKPDEHLDFEDTRLPVTSVQFKLSRVQDMNKQKAFVFYGFSKLESSKWIYLDSKLRHHSFLAKDLPLSECTYDNIKSLEHPSNQFSAHNHQSSQKKPVRCSLAMGIAKESHIIRNSHPPSSDSKFGQVIPLSSPYSAAPAQFLSLHLQLLMERNLAYPETTGQHVIHDTSQGKFYGNVPEAIFKNNMEPLVPLATSTDFEGLENNAPINIEVLEKDASTDIERLEKNAPTDIEGPEKIALTDIESLEKNAPTEFVGLEKSASTHIKGLVNNASAYIEGSEKNASNLVLSQLQFCTGDEQSYPVAASPQPALDHANNAIPSLDLVDLPFNGREHFSVIPQSPNQNGPSASCNLIHQNQNISLSSPVGELSPVWSDVKMSFMHNGFVNGPKKPRTQVHYTLPSGSNDFGSRHKNQGQKNLHCKRIRRASEKKIFDGGRSSQRNIEFLACNANVLVTVGDKGWRENDARVVLEVADHNEWRLSIKFSGSTKYSCTVRNILQPGSTNRFTHAMMWKGGKDWVLEFPDRSQWMLFKEMHEECHNRNIRAALVKNIPIPGVRLIEEMEDDTACIPFARSCPDYFHQVENDVDMAMNSSRILYDMDSEDECWLSSNQIFSHSGGYNEISDELFEKTMNMFEKVSYAEQRENFTSDELEELMAGIGFMEVVKSVYEHWKLKRKKNGMPLLRQFQRPLWEMYQQQVKDWEQEVSKAVAANHGKTPLIEKPQMFAFCLKPRGLENPNRGSKQRSQKRIPIAGHNHTSFRDQDGIHAFGRRMNGYALGDEMIVCTGNNHELLDIASSPTCHASRSAFSPRDASGDFSLNNEGYEWNHHPKLQRNKSKRIGTILPPGSPHLVSSHDRRITKRNGFHPSDWSSPKLDQHFDMPNIQELRLRDASSAAKHACTVAKQKREKAKRLMYTADLAIQKAVVALMNVDAMKASATDQNHRQ
ncbi:unnamed protein product [Cuscuta campestris]|uniref:Enhancer of polycomb-like protein n=1 Tax=Cuscuta campestris TaxID=132261 RepID=A0A484M724_9ASTE|nr:unnamed protein product [Cuscuta campestris]